MLVNIYETGYLDANKSYKQSFIKGVVSGLGGVIGATVVVALLLWILSILHFVPGIHFVTDELRSTVQTDK